MDITTRVRRFDNKKKAIVSIDANDEVTHIIASTFCTLIINLG